MDRRHALKLLLCSGAPLLLPGLARRTWASRLPLDSCCGSLVVHNTHTDERLEVDYLTPQGEFDPAALARLDRLFRCHFTGECTPIDPRLYTLLDGLRGSLGAADRPYLLISGYRSPRYNRELIARGRKVARNSYHLKGMAADIRLEGVAMASLHEAAVGCRLGGVGHYSDFIHVDVGPVRYW